MKIFRRKNLWKIVKKFSLKFKDVLTRDSFYIFGVFIFSMSAVIFGIYHTGSQNKIEKLRSGISYLTEVRGITDSIYSDSQMASMLWTDHGFSKKAYKKYLELARIMNKSPENPKNLDEIKNHSDLEEAIDKSLISSYDYYLTNLIITKELHEDESKIYFMALLSFQYIAALFSLILAVKQINLKKKNN